MTDFTQYFPLELVVDILRYCLLGSDSLINYIRLLHINKTSRHIMRTESILWDSLTLITNDRFKILFQLNLDVKFRSKQLDIKLCWQDQISTTDFIWLLEKCPNVKKISLYQSTLSDVDKLLQHNLSFPHLYYLDLRLSGYSFNDHEFQKTIQSLQGYFQPVQTLPAQCYCCAERFQFQPTDIMICSDCNIAFPPFCRDCLCHLGYALCQCEDPMDDGSCARFCPGCVIENGYMMCDMCYQWDFECANNESTYDIRRCNVDGCSRCVCYNCFVDDEWENCRSCHKCFCPEHEHFCMM